LLFLFDIALKVLFRKIKQEKGSYPAEKKENIFTDAMILYIENPKEYTKNTNRTNK
jgi:hypothetical protein